MTAIMRAALATGVLQLAPALLSVGPVRRRVAPRLAGRSGGPHIALTFDDGPDAQSTPRFLDLLARHDVRATFFLLGAYIAGHTGLVREMAAQGHELGVHGWDHRCTALLRPGVLPGQLERAAEAVTAASGRPVRWYRPPYGVLTAETLVAARAAGLTTVLWTAWGRDWERGATGGSVAATVDRTLTPGGTVLLHDSDRTSAPGSWRATLGATEQLVQRWAAVGQPVGPLNDHALARCAAPSRRPREHGGTQGH